MEFLSYVGSKMIEAGPCTMAEAESITGRTLGGKHPGDAPGYLVKYSDDYLSWSPAGVFEEAYYPITCMDFGAALCAMEHGYKVRLPEWEAGLHFSMESGTVVPSKPYALTFSCISRDDWSIAQ